VFNNRFGPKLPGSIPLGGIRVGNGIAFPDLQGNLHSTPDGAIAANQGLESSFSRGASGGCPQDPKQVPNTGKK